MAFFSGKIAEAVVKLTLDETGLTAALSSLQSRGIMPAVNLMEILRMAIQGVKKALDFAVSAVKRFSDEIEILNKFNVVFGKSRGEAEEWVKSFSTLTGRSQQDIRKWASGFQDVLVPFGIAREDAAKLSIEMVKLGADLASFNNIQTEEALERMKSGFMGLTRSLRPLGIGINNTIVMQEALTMTGKKYARQITELDKFMARYALSVRFSQDAMGDLVRTMGTVENQTQAVKGRFKDVQASIGKLIVEITSLLDILHFVNRALESLKVTMQDLASSPTVKAIGAITQLVATLAWNTSLAVLQFKALRNIIRGVADPLEEAKRSILAMQKPFIDFWQRYTDSWKEIDKSVVTSEKTFAKAEMNKRKEMRKTMGIMAGFEAVWKLFNNLTQDAEDKKEAGKIKRKTAIELKMAELNKFAPGRVMLPQTVSGGPTVENAEQIRINEVFTELRRANLQHKKWEIQNPEKTTGEVIAMAFRIMSGMERRNPTPRAEEPAFVTLDQILRTMMNIDAKTPSLSGVKVENPSTFI